jgi:hypothetical protein
MRSSFPVLAFGGVLGFLIAKTFFFPDPPSSRLEFDRAVPITSPLEGAQAYFRRELFLARRPAHAWLGLAATDSFMVYVNGRELANRSFVKTNVAGVFPINHLLVEGKNVIAVLVRRKSLPRRPALVLQAAFTDADGRTRRIYTGDGWRSTAFQGRQHGLGWTETSFDDRHWAFAVSAGDGWGDTVEPLALPPEAVTEAPQGVAVWHPDPRARRVVLSTRFELTEKPRSGWIRVASEGRYRIMINGSTVASSPGDRGAYSFADVTAYVRKGTNTAQIEAERAANDTAGLAADGRFESVSETVWIATGTSWKAEFGEAAIAVENAVPVPDQAYTLLPEPAPLVSARSTTLYSRLAWMAILVGLGSIAAYVFWLAAAYVGTRPLDLPTSVGLEQLSLAHIPPLVFMLYLLAARFDVSQALDSPFDSSVIVKAVLALFAIEALVIAEKWIRRRGDSVVSTEAV